jgi:hypothetical protein
MLRWVVAGLLVAHGLVHIAVWASTKVAEGQGSIPDRSWILGTQHSLVLGMTDLVVALFALAGVALLFQAGWWPQLTVASASASLLLVALFPGAIVGPWIVAPIAINVALIAAVWLSWPESLMTG